MSLWCGSSLACRRRVSDQVGGQLWQSRGLDRGKAAPARPFTVARSTSRRTTIRHPDPSPGTAHRVSGACRSGGNEDELPAGSVWCIPDLLDVEATRSQRSCDLGRRSESKRRIRFQNRVVAEKSERPPKGHQRKLDPRQPNPRLDRAEDRVPGGPGQFRCPRLPSAKRGVPHFEHEATAGFERVMARSQRCVPRHIVDVDLGDVPRHRDQIDTHRWQRRCLTEHPPNSFRVGLATGDREGRIGWIDTGHPGPGSGQSNGEFAGAASDVEHRTDPELVRQREVVIEVAAVPIEVVVDVGEPLRREDGVGHGRPP